VPERADKILRDADIDANGAGVRAISAAARPLAELEPALNTGAIRAIVVLGNELSLGDTAKGRLAQLDALIVLAWRELEAAKAASIALPIAAWAEIAGTVTNRQGRVQRMHPAFPPPGQAVPAWEAVARLANATGVKQAWTHPREVFKDMIAAVPEMAGAQWGRETRPIQLRFAYSRG
jgi:predicted molibdopterin-dependent oxidoreductase YjgC